MALYVMHRGPITHLGGAIINAEIRLIRTIINYRGEPRASISACTAIGLKRDKQILLRLIPVWRYP